MRGATRHKSEPGAGQSHSQLSTKMGRPKKREHNLRRNRADSGFRACSIGFRAPMLPCPVVFRKNGVTNVAGTKKEKRMSGSSEERDRANSRGTLDVLQAPDHEEVPSQEDEEPTAVVNRIRGIAASLDVHDLREEELTALSDAALSLLDVAKAQVQDRDIASRRAQVEDWERQHEEVIAGAELVTDVLAALKERIDEGEMGRDDFRVIFDLLEGWLTAEADYHATKEQLRKATNEDDLQSLRSLPDTLELLIAGRRQARADIDGALAMLGRGRSTPEEPAAADRAKPSEPEPTAPAEGMEDATRSADQPAPSTSVPSEDAQESPAEEAPTVRDEGKEGQPSAAAGSPIQPDDGESGVESAGDPAESADDNVESVQPIEDAIAMSIEQGRLGLAYHFSLAAPDALPSASAIKLAAYSYVIDEHTPVTVAAELPELAAALLQEAEAEAVADKRPGWDSHALLTTCAALAPALVAPGGPVAQLLNFLEPRLEDTPSLRALAKIAAEVSMTGVHLPMDLLRGEDSLERWHERKSALRNDTKSWLTNERQSQIKYQAATKVWRRMLDDWERNNGQSSLGRMFSLLDEAVNKIDIDSVTRISQYWKSSGEKEIDRIDRENRSWKPTNKIKGPARLNLRTKVHQALDLSDRWLRLIRERPEKREPFQTEQARLLRTTVRNKVDAALAEMNAVPRHKREGARALLRRYAALFNSADGRLDRSRIGLADMLHGDLLAHPEIVFDDTGQLPTSPVDLDVLRKLAKQDTPDFGQAAVERAKRRDLIGAEAVIDFAVRTGRIDEERADQSRAVIESQREHIQAQLKDKISDTSNRLDAAYAAGALSLDTFEQQRERLPSDDLSGRNTFEPLFTTLDEIDQDIADAESGRRDAMRQELSKLLGLSEEEKERIQSAINSRRFQVAEDFIDRIKQDEKLPARDTKGRRPAHDTKGRRPFDTFFPNFVQEYSDLRDREVDGVLRSRDVIARRASEGFIDASGLSEDASQDGLELLDAWVALRDGETSIDGLRTLMSALGFAHAEVRRTDDDTLGGETIFLLDALPVTDRSIAQLPDFGSRADGRYRLFTVRKRKTGEAIVREVERQPGAARAPNIALFLGILDTDARRVLARDLHTGGYHPTIVLDESLAVFLAAWSGQRLAAFFDCVSAFTFSQPFEPDAAELPPEMFFGRRDVELPRFHGRLVSGVDGV